MDERAFKTLKDFLEKVPAIQKQIGIGADEKGFWWVKFRIDIKNELAWKLLRLCSNGVSEENLLKTKTILANYFADKATDATDKACDEKILTEQIMVDWTIEQNRARI